jgi:hypothetical protein
MVQEEKPREWDVLDLPEDLYVLINNETREEFFQCMYKKFGSQKKYAKFLKKDRITLQSYHYARSWDKGKKHRKLLPISIIPKSLPFIDNLLIEKIKNSILEIRIQNVGKSINNPVLPIKESPALYRVVAHLIGDGNDSHTPYYANTCSELREQFKNDLQIFGKVYHYESIPNTTPCVNFPKVITHILTHILQVRFTRPNSIPQQVFKASKECKKAFLQALFDDEGTVSTVLSICIHNINILNQLKHLLKEFDIKTGETTTIPYVTKKGKRYRSSFNISSKAYKEFKEKVNFIHPKKALNLEAAIKTRERRESTRPREFIEDEIIKILKNNPSRTIELANQLQFTMSGVNRHLHKLYNEKRIIKEGPITKLIWKLA